MSFIGDLFGGGDQPALTPVAPAATPPTPTPVAATPTIDDAASISAAQEESTRLNQRYGQDSTMLTSGLGDSSSGGNNVSRVSALGGNTTLTPTS